ncbi:MAG TPA: PQQ-binding-like beta-propeller repeat protein, partial [Terriglobales bacterium]|nr:PQQ-binding-like beta-propeller repeat protein [Terriglobales bacterium]
RDDMKGSPPTFPALIGVGKRMDRAAMSDVIIKGKGRMPSFPQLSPDEVNALIDYLSKGENKELPAAEPAPPAMPYRFSGYTRFLDPEGYPAVAPPWGTLNAINLNTGEYAWKIPFGEYPALVAQGIKNTGTENYGGPVVTAGGLLFIAATNYDKKFRAFNKATGELLWETPLPFAGNATPITYEVNGRQYVVIAAGGGKDLKSKSGGVYIAFALPSK